MLCHHKLLERQTGWYYDGQDHYGQLTLTVATRSVTPFKVNCRYTKHAKHHRTILIDHVDHCIILRHIQESCAHIENKGDQHNDSDGNLYMWHVFSVCNHQMLAHRCSHLKHVGKTLDQRRRRWSSVFSNVCLNFILSAGHRWSLSECHQAVVRMTVTLTHEETQDTDGLPWLLWVHVLPTRL